jgi:uncharacterized protein YhdP
LMRTLGVFNFNELLRRLRLDFKDFYQTGLAFDRFSAGLDFGAAMARTRSPFELTGPAARLRMNGEADLAQRTVSGQLIATLPIGSNLPWVAVLAGGIPAAAGVYVASKIFETQLGKFSSAVYQVSGAIDEPQIELLRVFDTEADEPKLEIPADGSDVDAGASAGGDKSGGDAGLAPGPAQD